MFGFKPHIELREPTDQELHDEELVDEIVTELGEDEEFCDALGDLIDVAVLRAIHRARGTSSTLPVIRIDKAQGYIPRTVVELQCAILAARDLGMCARICWDIKNRRFAISSGGVQEPSCIPLFDVRPADDAGIQKAAP
jgi:hypothetical protein